jgi:hypothetical protein
MKLAGFSLGKVWILIWMKGVSYQSRNMPVLTMAYGTNTQGYVKVIGKNGIE